MNKFEIRLKELGLTVDDLSIRLKNEIAEFYNIEKAVSEMGQNDAESEGYINASQELQKVDNVLVNKINKYEKNKEGYKERALKMQEARRGKVVVDETETHRNVNTQRQYEPKIPTFRKFEDEVRVKQVEVNKVDVKKPKKDFALWVLAGIVGVITLGSVIMNKNK